MRIAAQPDGTLLLTVVGESGVDYGVETSSNLVNWISWTNQVATNGAISIVDHLQTNQPHKFYRAIFIP